MVGGDLLALRALSSSLLALLHLMGLSILRFLDAAAVGDLPYTVMCPKILLLVLVVGFL